MKLTKEQCNVALLNLKYLRNDSKLTTMSYDIINKLIKEHFKQYKPGDRVEILSNVGIRAFESISQGTIIKVKLDEIYPYIVQFDNGKENAYCMNELRLLDAN